MKQVPTKNIGDTLSSEEFDFGGNAERKNFVTDTGQSFDQANQKQMLQSANRIAFARTSLKETAGSTGAAYKLGIIQVGSEPLTSLLDGSTFRFKVVNANTTETPTIIINSLNPLPPAIPLRNQDGSDLYIGQLAVGDIVTVYYNEIESRCEILSDNSILNETRDVNLSNFHNVVSFTPAGNVYLLQSPGGSQPIYHGYIIRFKATDTITGATHISLSETTSLNIPLRKNNRELVAGDIKMGDVITAVASNDNTFQIISQTFQTWLNSSNQVVSKDLEGGERVIYYNASSTQHLAGGSPYQLTELDDKKTFLISSFTGTQTIVLPSKTAPFAPNFTCEFSVYEPFGGQIVFEAPPGETFLRDGGDNSSYTLRLNYGDFAKLIGSNVRLKIFFISDFSGFILSGVDNATYDVQGVGTIARQQLVDAGVDEQAWVTSKTFKQGLINAGYIGIKDNNPVGTIREFGNDFDPNSDPAFSSGGMVWTEINAGYVCQTTNTPGQAGTYAGANSFQGGGTNGTSLTIAQIPAHTHPVEYVNDTGKDTLPVAIGTNSAVHADINTKPVGGSQAHSHVLDGKVFYVRKWMRTV